jgi:hypothetical protein
MGTMLLDGGVGASLSGDKLISWIPLSRKVPKTCGIMMCGYGEIIPRNSVSTGESAHACRWVDIKLTYLVNYSTRTFAFLGPIILKLEAELEQALIPAETSLRDPAGSRPSTHGSR